MNKTTRRYATRLEPLTVSEVLRMQNLYASGPLTTTAASEKADEGLIRKGWALKDAEYENAMMPTLAAYGRKSEEDPKPAHCVLYDDKGMVHACWRVRVAA